MPNRPKERSPTLGQVINAALERGVKGFHVAMPARVVKYNSADQSVDVQPTIRQSYLDEDGNRQSEAYPVLVHVPLMFVGGGGMYLTFPVQAGDTVLCIFADHSIDKWLQEDADDTDPDDDRMHNLSDAFAIPGVRTLKNTRSEMSEDAAVLAGDDIRLGGESSADPVARKSDIDAIKSAINGAVTVANDGGASLKATILSGWPSSVGSSKVKVD